MPAAISEFIALYEVFIRIFWLINIKINPRTNRKHSVAEFTLRQLTEHSIRGVHVLHVSTWYEVTCL